MKKRVFIFIAFTAMLIAERGSAQQQNVDSHRVSFTITNAGIDVDGSIHILEPVIHFYPQNLRESSLSAAVDVSTIDTGIGLRDKHLQGREYFDSDKFPRITLASKSITAVSKKSFRGVFSLTIRDVTKEVTIPFTYIKKGEGFTLNGTFELNRLDFGIGKKSVILSENVSVRIEIKVSSLQNLTETD